jgi:two-component system chemotaxis response regulator CheB
VRVLVVDDSAAARDLIVQILASDPEIEIAGVARDGFEALAMIERQRPTVVTMDLVMPGLSGLDAIERIMASTPTPIVVVATPQPSNPWVFSSMEAGAVTVLEKPGGPRTPGFEEDARRLISTVKMAAAASVTRRTHRRSRGLDPRRVARDGPSPARGADVVAIAASTGGPPAVGEILRSLPVDFPAPVVLVQHIASGFEFGLAQWLDEVCPLPVRVAGEGEPLLGGEVLLAPADLHLGVSESRATALSDAPPINNLRPSATFLFRAVAAQYGRRALAVVLTGMGSDGAEGLIDLKRAGGSVLVQDPDTSIVSGMPTAAVRAVAADRVLPLEDIAGAIVEHCCGGARTAS